MPQVKKTAVASRRKVSEAWRLSNAGRLLSNALARFEARVLDLMAEAGHDQTRASHVNLTRHLDLGGTRITELAERARMTGAAMSELIGQCEALGMVRREVDPADGRARVVMFTETGLVWLASFGQAVKRAEKELRRELGPEAARLLEGLENYGQGVESLRAARSPRSPHP